MNRINNNKIGFQGWNRFPYTTAAFQQKVSQFRKIVVPEYGTDRWLLNIKLTVFRNVLTKS